MKTRVAKLTDVDGLLHLVNRAYRQSHPNSWTNEATLISGDRIQREQLEALINDPSIQVMLHEDEQGLLACITVTDRGKTAEIGLFAVLPEVQKKGIGREVLATAEEYIYYFCEKVKNIEIQVIQQREELVGFYQRQGYNLTDLIQPYPSDQQLGVPSLPLNVVTLVKSLER